MNPTTCRHCGAANSPNAKYCAQCGQELVHTGSPSSMPPQPAGPAPAKKNKVISIIASVVAFALAYWAAQRLFFNRPSFDKTMMQVAGEINKSCPIMVDEYTRLDNTVALPNNIFQYNYTLVKTSKEEIDPDTLRKYVEPDIVNNMKTNPDMKVYREHKTTMVYYYKDKNGVFVYKLSVTPDMYQ